jgi:hypothetical protein
MEPNLPFKGIIIAMLLCAPFWLLVVWWVVR